MMNELSLRFNQLKSDIIAADVTSYTKCNNRTRRVLYARLELLRLDYEAEFPHANKKSDAESTTGANGDADSNATGGTCSKDEENKLRPSPSLSSHNSMSNMDASLLSTLTDVYSEMDTLGKTLRIVPLYSSRQAASPQPLFHKIWRVIDIIIRFIAVCLGFVTIGTFLSLPVIALQYLDNSVLLPLGLVTCYTQYSERIRRWIGHVFLLLSGIFVTVEGLEQDYYSEQYMSKARAAAAMGSGGAGRAAHSDADHKQHQHQHQSSSSSFSEHQRQQLDQLYPRHAFSTHSSCSMLTFSHASNIDGFLICSTCPIRHYALAKKELFVTPLFSWISLAVGGVPIDRNNRDRAINALKRSTEAVMSTGNHGRNGHDGAADSAASSSSNPNQACIVIAPEGTRSTTGQLLAFKKGPFYMWEQLQVPVVPLLLLGAYDLYPVGNWVNDTGHVTVRYLPPVYPEQASSRGDMAAKLRRIYLESTLNTPEQDALVQPLTWGEFIYHYGAIMLLFVIDYVLYTGGEKLFFDVLGYTSGFTVWLHLSILTVAITAFLYIYYVYIVGAGSAKKKSHNHHHHNSHHGHSSNSGSSDNKKME